MSDTQNRTRNPVAFFIMGMMVVPTFVLLTSYILWLTMHDLYGIFWMATVLTGFLTLTATFHMIASRWAAWSVSLFATTVSVLIGLCFVGVSVLGTSWCLAAGMGLFFVTLLVILFTDLDDHIKLPLIVISMIVEFSAVWIFFSWLAQTAQS